MVHVAPERARAGRELGEERGVAVVSEVITEEDKKALAGVARLAAKRIAERMGRKPKAIMLLVHFGGDITNAANSMCLDASIEDPSDLLADLTILAHPPGGMIDE